MMESNFFVIQENPEYLALKQEICNEFEDLSADQQSKMVEVTALQKNVSPTVRLMAGIRIDDIWHWQQTPENTIFIYTSKDGWELDICLDHWLTIVGKRKSIFSRLVEFFKS